MSSSVPSTSSNSTAIAAQEARIHANKERIEALRGRKVETPQRQPTRESSGTASGNSDGWWWGAALVGTIAVVLLKGFSEDDTGKKVQTSSTSSRRQTNGDDWEPWMR